MTMHCLGWSVNDNYTKIADLCMTMHWLGWSVHDNYTKIDLPVHDDALAGLVEAGHELLVDDHLGDESVHRVHGPAQTCPPG